MRAYARVNREKARCNFLYDFLSIWNTDIVSYKKLDFTPKSLSAHRGILIEEFFIWMEILFVIRRVIWVDRCLWTQHVYSEINIIDFSDVFFWITDKINSEALQVWFEPCWYLSELSLFWLLYHEKNMFGFVISYLNFYIFMEWQEQIIHMACNSNPIYHKTRPPKDSAFIEVRMYHLKKNRVSPPSPWILLLYER